MRLYGSAQVALLRRCAGGRSVTTARPSEYMAGLRLSGHGLLDRDPGFGKANTFIGNDAGDEALAEYDARRAVEGEEVWNRADVPRPARAA